MIETIEAPAAPFSAVDAVLRQFLRLDVSETYENDLIDGIIASAVAQAEAFTRLRLMPQQVRLLRDGFGCGGIVLPVAPVRSVLQVRYTAPDGTDTVLDPAAYRLASSSSPAVLEPVHGTSWPVLRDERASVRIDLEVGFAAGAAIPGDLMQALRMLVAHQWMNREVLGETGQEIPWGVRSILLRHVLWL